MNSDETNNPKPNAQPKDGTFSLEDLDQIIASEDPNFAKEMETLKSQNVEGSAALENLSIATEDDALKDEEGEKTRKQKVIDFLKRPFVSATAFVKSRAVSFKNRVHITVVNLNEFVRHELPDRLRYWRSQVVAFLAWFKAKIAVFNSYPRLHKLAFFFGVVSTLGSVTFLVMAFRGNYLPQWTDDLPRSMAGRRTFHGVVTHLKDLQDFYEAFPEVEYHLLLKKVVVNLKPDENSGPNPMGIFEFYVGVDSKDTALEVKEREREMLDVVQRTLEGYTYTDIASEYGKVRMKASIKDNLNRLLNQGFVYKLYFNQIVFYSNK